MFNPKRIRRLAVMLGTIVTFAWFVVQSSAFPVSEIDAIEQQQLLQRRHASTQLPASSPSSDHPASVVAQVQANASPARPVHVRHYTIVISEGTIWTQCSFPFTNATMYNGTSPGPTLRARAGEILQVRVINQSPRNSTVHFHGLAMRLHPIMDGTNMISQWPIAPGTFFDYRIPLTSEDAGTYFYHSHVGIQAMSAYGVLIVEDPLPSHHSNGEQNNQLPNQEQVDNIAELDKQSVSQAVNTTSSGKPLFKSIHGSAGLSKKGKSTKGSPFCYDEDRVLALGDFWNYTSQDKIMQGLDADVFQWPGSPSSLLFNGLASPPSSAATNVTTVTSSDGTTAQAVCDPDMASKIGVDCNTASRQCSSKSSNGTYPTLHLDYNKTYRLRFVGATALMYLSAGIVVPDLPSEKGWKLDNMTLIEADGSYITPLDVDHVEIFTGQRYSALYRSRTLQDVANDGSNGVYWLRMESRWRKGPDMWAKIQYPSPAPLLAAANITANTWSTKTDSPPSFSGNASSPNVYLPPESFGWITSQFSPLSGYTEEMPTDDQVTRRIVLGTRQIPYLTSQNGVKWAENGAVFNETVPSNASAGLPLLVSTFLGTNPIPTDYTRAFSSQNPWNKDPIGMGLIRNTTDETDFANKLNLSQGYDDLFNIYLAKPGEVIDIIIVNQPSRISNNTEIHPWHMHSKKHWTRMIQQGTFSFQRLDQIFNSNNNNNSFSSTDMVGFKNPIRRDTTVLYPGPGASYLNATVPDPANNDGGWAVLRYKVDEKNAGIFVLHCHILFHLYMGMATTWAIAPDQLRNQSLPYLPSTNQLAPTQGEVIQGLDANSFLTFGKDVPTVI